MKQLLFGLFVIGLLTSCAKKPLTSAERNLLVNPKSFEAYNIFFANADSIGKYKKVKFVDGGTELEFQFESSKSDSNELFINNVIAIEANKLEAKVAYAAERGALKIINKGGIKFHKLNDLFAYGDDSQFYLLETKDKTPIGNLLQYRKDKVVYFLVFFGVYFDDKTDWEDFILPKLKAIDEFVTQPK
ncbi:MAG: hypothetical protein ACPGJS_13205 [Flammeovirgaceae bacterium]